MRKKYALILLIASALLLFAWAYYKADSSRRRAALNELASLGWDFSQVDYPRYHVTRKEIIIPFPSDACSNPFFRRSVEGYKDSENAIFMLNVSSETYMAMREKYLHLDNRGTIELPLFWARRTSLGRTYFVYWAHYPPMEKGIMSKLEFDKFLASLKKLTDPKTVSPPEAGGNPDEGWR
jgi:hypothetical protein